VENSELFEFLAFNEIIKEPAAPEAQYQNPVEKGVQYVDNGVSTLLEASKLDHSYWGLALLSFIRNANLTPNKLSGEYSPHYHLTGKHPDLSNTSLYPFGQEVTVSRLKNEKEGRFSTRKLKGIAVGSTISNNGATLIRFHDRNSNKIALTRVNVRPLVLPPDSIKTNNNSNNNNNNNSTIESNAEEIEAEIINSIDVSQLYNSIIIDNIPIIDNGDNSTISTQNIHHNSNLVDTSNINMDHENQNNSIGSDYTNSSIANDRTRRSIKKPSKYDTYILAVKHSVEFPTYTQGMKSKDKHHWDKAVAAEFDTLTELGTYVEVNYEDIPKDALIYNSKMILKVKRNSLKEYLKHKARLVVLGDKFKLLSNLFAPTANTRSIQIIIALAIHLGLNIVGFDIYGAFLAPSINKAVYL
jgi:hypothetical protein